MELKPLVADEKMDPAAPVPLLATALAPEVATLTILLTALPTTEVRELMSWVAPREAAVRRRTEVWIFMMSECCCLKLVNVWCGNA